MKKSILFFLFAGLLIAQGIIQPPGAPVLKTPWAFFGFGDSYISGIGTLNPLASSAFALLARAIPTGIQSYNRSVGGTTSDSISIQAFEQFSPSGTQSAVSFIDGGANDGACGTSTGCLTNFSEELNGIEAWLTIPYSFRQMGSTGTGSNWVSDTTGNSYNPQCCVTQYIASPGFGISTTTSGASKTFSIPSSSSPVVGLTFEVTNSQTGTFTVSVDGVLQTDACSGTTTFTSAPCGTNLLQLTTTAFRQQFIVTTGTTHTVVISTTNTGKVNILCVDWIPPAGTSAVNTVFVLNVNLAFTNAALYNTASLAVVKALAGVGLPVYYVDQVNGIPGVNSTTDIATSATATCDASTLGSHPNSQCGYLHMAQTFYNAELANNYVFTGVPGSSNIASQASIPVIVKTIDLTTQTAALASQTLFIAPANGWYRISYTAAVSSVGSVSSVLGGTTGVTIVYSDGGDFVNRTVHLNEFDQNGALVAFGTGNTTNTTAATLQGSVNVFVSNGDFILYNFGYTSSGTAMQYQVHFVVEFL